MHLWIYCTDRNRSLKLLQAISFLPPELLTLDLCQSIESFIARLRQPIFHNTTVLFVTGEVEELQQIVPMRDFLGNLKVVMALPEDRPELLNLARRLWPRYISSWDNDFSDMAAVLEKMAHTLKRAERRRKVRLDVDEGWCESIGKPDHGQLFKRKR